MADRLWTPDGDVATHERSVNAISQADMEVFANMHRIAQKLGIGMHCLKCDRPFMGFNDEKGRTWSVACSCREVKATVRGNVVVV